MPNFGSVFHIRHQEWTIGKFFGKLYIIYSKQKTELVFSLFYLED